VPSPHRDFFVQYVEGRKQMDLGLRDEITASLRQYESALAQATKIPMRIVVAVAARFYGVQLAEVLGHARTRNVVSARKAVCYLAASLSGYSFAEIGRKLANRDHSTISYLYHSLADKMVTDSTLRIQVETIKEQIVEYFTTIRDEAA
jgi:chromosomal replication initiation ATPase DnaA